MKILNIFLRYGTFFELKELMSLIAINAHILFEEYGHLLYFLFSKNHIFRFFNS
jgi:hypothetical protein